MTDGRFFNSKSIAPMKTTPWITLAAMISTSLILSAQDKPQGPAHSKGPPPRMVKKFDKDGDGKLSDEERKAMEEARLAKVEEMKKQAIAKFDKDGDGKLNDEEKAAARTANQAVMLKKFDTDGDGKISDAERGKLPKPPMGHGGPGGKEGHGGPGGPKGPAGGGAPPASPINPPAE
jgi:Ca2+-binding EF-hand superfamily protein